MPKRKAQLRSVQFSLPYPPSTNKYWRMVSGKMLISREGRTYADRVRYAVRDVAVGATSARLAVSILAHPPDRRRRDLDNLLKATLDALTKAGVWQDDEQIDSLRIRRGDVQRPDGLLRIEIRELEAQALTDEWSKSS